MSEFIRKLTAPKDDTTLQTEIRNPATGALLGYSQLNSVAEVRQAIEQARAVQPQWVSTPIKERVRLMKKVQRYLADHMDDLSEIVSRDNGKTRIEALATEILPAAMAVAYYCRQADRFLRPQKIAPGNLFLLNKRSRIERVPFGVVGIISPWNYPFSIPFSEVVMALLAGNAVILKTASETQLVGRTLEACFQAADLPSGLFHYVNVPGRQSSEAMLDGGVDKLFFTGSVPVGKQIMARAAETLTPVVLELGGNDAMLVCEDADLERAAEGAVWAGLQNCGQSCGGVERIYVHESVYNAFLERLKEKVETLRIGYDTDHQVDLGAITVERQMETVQTHMVDALEKGAVVFAQAEVSEECPDGQFMPAAVLTDVDHTMLVMQEETFGPVLGVMKVKNMDEAIELANDSNLGLTGSVWSRNRPKAKQLARRIKAGAITINDHLMSHGLAETPWGGFKQSSIGRTHGQLGFDEMTQPQVIVDDWLGFTKRQLWWPPYSPEIYEGLRGIMTALYQPGLGGKWAGLRKVLKILPRMFK